MDKEEAKQRRREAFASKNSHRKWGKEDTTHTRAEKKLAREIRRGLSGKFGREKKELTERATPGTFWK